MEIIQFFFGDLLHFICLVIFLFIVGGFTLDIVHKITNRRK